MNGTIICANPAAAEFSGTYNTDRAPGLLRLFHERGHNTIRVFCPIAWSGSTEPYCVSYPRKLFPEATIVTY